MDEKLIELVRTFPVLYDLSHKKYMDIGFKNNTWNDIGKELKLEELNSDQVKSLDPLRVRNITFQDFVESLKRIRKSVSPLSLAAYDKWNKEYGDMSL